MLSCGIVPQTLMTSLAGVGLTWLVQSTALLALGLLAGRLVKTAGAAVQSAVYRTTLAAVLVCPVASVDPDRGGLRRLDVSASDTDDRQSSAHRPRNLCPARRDRGDGEADREPLPAARDWTGTTARLANETPSELMLTARYGDIRNRRRRIRSSAIELVPAIGLSIWLLGAVGDGRAAGRRPPQDDAAAGRRRSRPSQARSALCRDLAARMGVGTPAVLRSPFLFSPCLDGLRKPVILLPEDADENLRETFIHELAHLARHDGLWNLVQACRAWRRFGSSRCSGPFRGGWKAWPKRSATTTSSSSGPTGRATRATCWNSPNARLPPLAPAGVGMVSLRSMLARRIVRLLDTSRSLSTRAGTRAVARHARRRPRRNAACRAARRGQRSAARRWQRSRRRNPKRKARPSAVRSSVPTGSPSRART